MPMRTRADDQGGQVLGHPAHDAAEQDGDDADHEHPARSELLGQLACRRLGDRARQIERRDQDQGAADRDVQGGGDRDQGGGDDRAVDGIERGPHVQGREESPGERVRARRLIGRRDHRLSPSRSISGAAARRVSISAWVNPLASALASCSIWALRLFHSGLLAGRGHRHRHAPAVSGSRRRSTRPRRSSAASVAPIACGLIRSTLARSLVVADPARSRRDSADSSESERSGWTDDCWSRRTNRPMPTLSAEATAFTSRSSAMTESLDFTT